MKTITPEHVAFYQENGFVVVEDFLSPQELTAWQTATDEAVRDRLTAPTDGKWNLTNQGNPDSYYAKVFTQCLKLADTNEKMHALMHDERLGEAAGTLAQVDGIRIWHDQALIKPPFGNPTAWHLDNPYWSFSSRDALSLWVALDDATLANGALFYIPGSHKTARFENVGIGEAQADLFNVYKEWREIETVGCPCSKGSAVFHNGLTAHGAGANMTSKPRRAMTCAYMPDGSVFNGNKNVLPDEYFARLKIGDVLDDSEVVPLIWHK